MLSSLKYEIAPLLLTYPENPLAIVQIDFDLYFDRFRPCAMLYDTDETIAIEMFRIMIGSSLIVLFKGNARLLVPKCRTNDDLVNFLIAGFSRSTEA